MTTVAIAGTLRNLWSIHSRLRLRSQSLRRSAEALREGGRVRYELGANGRRTAVEGGGGRTVAADSWRTGGSGGSAAARVAGRSRRRGVARAGEPAAAKTAPLRSR